MYVYQHICIIYVYIDRYYKPYFSCQFSLSPHVFFSLPRDQDLGHPLCDGIPGEDLFRCRLRPQASIWPWNAYIEFM